VKSVTARTIQKPEGPRNLRVELPPGLLQKVNIAAAKQNVTIRAFVAEALKSAVTENRRAAQ
jgi:predicted HicB family RNase H-like nuclease